MSEIIYNKPVSQNFLPEPIKDEHYVLGDGKLSASVLMPDGHGWGKYLPLGETQYKNGIDPQSCPAGGSLNCLEAIGNKKYNEHLKGYKIFQDDLSERALAILMGMDGHGGYPHDAAEKIRTIGVLPEAFLPFDKTITDLKKYFSPKPLSYTLFKYCYSWIKKYTFGHQWLFYGNEPVSYKQQAIKEGLKYSPVGVAGYAWSLHSDGKYYHDGPDVHWFIVFDYVEGEYWMAFDTYEPYIKKLDWQYNFGYAKGYSLDRKIGSAEIEEEPLSPIIPYLIYWLKSLLWNS